MLFRHAEAVPHGIVPDADRDLSPAGIEEAREMGRYCFDEMLLPDLVLVSPALRTRKTWETASAFLVDAPAEFASAIYRADERLLFDLVRATDDDVRCLMIVGHNPAVEDLARALVLHGDRYALSRMQLQFPTGGLAVLDFACDHWSEAERRSARLDRFRVPSGGGG
jgi:phosphohistidine phosphatase